MFWAGPGPKGGGEGGVTVIWGFGLAPVPGGQLGNRSWDMGGNKTEAQEALALAPLRQPLHTLPRSSPDIQERKWDPLSVAERLGQMLAIPAPHVS